MTPRRLSLRDGMDVTDASGLSRNREIPTDVKIGDVILAEHHLHVIETDLLPDLEFSELTAGWRSLPDWVRWFVRVGYAWNPPGPKRRLCVISVPCDSPGAGLIALGMLRRRLCLADAGDIASHLAYLKRLFATDRTGALLRRTGSRKRFRFIEPDVEGRLRVSPEGDPDERHTIVEEFAYDWCVDGEPHPVAPRGRPLKLPLAVLDRILPNACPVVTENLARTDSAICLAGSVAGESRAMAYLSAVRFRMNSEVYTLGSMLAIHGWQEGAVSRMTFYNGRTRTLDRQVRAPVALCVDGGQALLEVLDDSKRFGNADVIGVLSRTADPDLLDRVAQRLASLSQWYVRDPHASHVFEGGPTGIATVSLIQE
jgi:hypothetical protein